MTNKKVESNEKMQEPVYTKEQILDSKKYAHRRDILGVLLHDEKEYTVKEIDSLLEKFMKGKVN